MLNTIQVRALMRKNGASNSRIYTNKVTDQTLRTVKCYADEVNEKALVAELTKLGADFKVTKGAEHWRSMGPGIIVRCLAE